MGSKPRVTILTGTRFNNLVILREVDNIIIGKESRRAVEVQCDCGHIFITRYSALVTGNTKTCGCSSKYVTHGNRQASLDKVLRSSTLQRASFERIEAGSQKVEFLCRVCSKTFYRDFNVVISVTQSCPHCIGTYEYGEDHYIQSIKDRLIDSPLYFLEKFNTDKPLTTNCKVLLKCLECDSVIARKTSHILSRKNYCHCNRLGGFNPTKPANLYLLQLSDLGGAIVGYKYGIAACTDSRHKQISKSFKGKAVPWMVWEYEDGHIAQMHENIFKKLFSPVLDKELMGDGWTETFGKELLSQFLLIQSLQYGELSWTY